MLNWCARDTRRARRWRQRHRRPPPPAAARRRRTLQALWPPWMTCGATCLAARPLTYRRPSRRYRCQPRPWLSASSPFLSVLPSDGAWAAACSGELALTPVVFVRWAAVAVVRFVVRPDHRRTEVLAYFKENRLYYPATIESHDPAKVRCGQRPSSLARSCLTRTRHGPAGEVRYR